MKTKSVIQGDAVDRIVDDMLMGMVRTQPHLALVQAQRVVLHREFEAIRQRQVTLLAGGGSGHEPAHAGYIGDGMLTGVVCGSVFASPTTQQVLTAIRMLAGPHGCLVIMKNYTGDRINFGLALEQAKAEGLRVDMVVVGDDIAAINASAGRRGLCGTVLVHKLAGAAAQRGMALEGIVTLVNEHASTSTLGTFGVALNACTLPGRDRPTRELFDNEMELGMGIHGEPGVEKCAVEDVSTLVDKMVQRLTNALDVRDGSKVVLVVNNLGATTAMELNVVAKHVLDTASARGVSIERALVGSFMTALDMTGFSLTMWKIGGRLELLEYLDALTSAPAWMCHAPASHASLTQFLEPPASMQATQAQSFQRPPHLTPAGEVVEVCIRAACESLIAGEQELSDWDAKVGDGDCGATFKAAAQAILADMQKHYPLNDPVATLRALAASISNTAGGTSGVLYTIFFTAAAAAMSEHATPGVQESWKAAFTAGVSAVQRYGGAREGSRTMLDACLPVVQLLASQAYQAQPVEELHQIERAAVTGAVKTRDIPASRAFGRTGYVAEWIVRDVPDPGAMAMATWIQAVAGVLRFSMLGGQVSQYLASSKSHTGD